MSIPQTGSPASATATDAAGAAPKIDSDDARGIVETTIIDPSTCTPEELSSWLLRHRFRDDAAGAAGFLLQCASSLPDAETIMAGLLGGDGGDESDDEDEEDAMEVEAVDADDDGEEVAKPESLLRTIVESGPLGDGRVAEGVEVSCTAPRGKFLLRCYESGITLTNPKKADDPRERVAISNENVEHVVWFRKPEDYRKVKQISQRLNDGEGGGGGGRGKKDAGMPGHMVLICLKEGSAAAEEEEGGTTFRGKALGQVCFQLPSYPLPDASDDEEGTTEMDWWKILGSGLASTSRMVRVRSQFENNSSSSSGKAGGAYAFQAEGDSQSTSTATTTQGMPFVGCYRGFSDGSLFPLEEGLLFFKPPLFVPRADLASISCGRGAGSRYVDMVVQLDEKDDDGGDSGGEGGSAKKKKKGSSTLEFTNIHRDELTALNDYIHGTLIPAMQADAEDGGSNGTAGEGVGTHGDCGSGDDEDEAVAEVVGDSDGDEDDRDEDKSDDGSSGGGSTGSKRRRSSRAASRSAREINRAALRARPGEEEDGEDDDSDVFEEHESDEESDESDDDGEDAEGSSEEEEFDEEDGEEEDDESLDKDDNNERTRREKKKARVE